MLLTPHALTGAFIGHITQNPYLAISFGILSHHVLDMIPHFDQGSFRIRNFRAPYLNYLENYDRSKFNNRDWTILIIDFIISAIIFISLLFVFSFDAFIILALGAFGGILPDLIGSSPLWSETLEKKIKIALIYKKFHSYFHFTVSKKEIIFGISTQIILTIFILYLLITLKT